VGDYKTEHEALRASDVANVCAGTNKPLIFHDSVSFFVAIPPVSLEEAHKSESSRKEFSFFIREQARKAARRALDDPEWKRTYDEWCFQVMWFKVCRIFWL
jgi:hypothetical protein